MNKKNVNEDIVLTNLKDLHHILFADKNFDADLHHILFADKNF